MDKVREQVCHGALTHNSKHSGAAAHFRWVIIVSLRMAASAVAPSSPMRFFPILRGLGWGTVRGCMSDSKTNTLRRRRT